MNVKFILHFQKLKYQREIKKKRIGIDSFFFFLETSERNRNKFTVFFNSRG